MFSATPASSMPVVMLFAMIGTISPKQTLASISCLGHGTVSQQWESN